MDWFSWTRKIFLMRFAIRKIKSKERKNSLWMHLFVCKYRFVLHKKEPLTKIRQRISLANKDGSCAYFIKLKEEGEEKKNTRTKDMLDSIGWHAASWSLILLLSLAEVVLIAKYSNRERAFKMDKYLYAYASRSIQSAFHLPFFNLIRSNVIQFSIEIKMGNHRAEKHTNGKSTASAHFAEMHSRKQRVQNRNIYIYTHTHIHIVYLIFGCCFFCVVVHCRCLQWNGSTKKVIHAHWHRNWSCAKQFVYMKSTRTLNWWYMVSTHQYLMLAHFLRRGGNIGLFIDWNMRDKKKTNYQ